ncbi:hypothetical protein [Methanospirillum hungatei]|uniref:hypothetical protein n=1 Tax=Methanospirillum hungatei TaxID=2203 RepID=UPI0026EF2ECD|nr:hypothetical protein [Methanospirillum hungatei]MCA1916439.1 hypothetical protein [Methanospirillum hungatei]
MDDAVFLTYILEKPRLFLSRMVLILCVFLCMIAPIQAERVFFSDGTLYNGSLSKDDILEKFEEYTGEGPVIVFHDLICLSCQDAMDYFREFEQLYPEIPLVYYDLHGNTTNKLLFEKYMKDYHQENLLAPTAFVGPAGIEGNESIRLVFEPFALLYVDNQ